jgi:DNA polymerase III alpha subunit
LNCHTSLSFKYGTLSIDELFAEAKRCGVHKLALTEINNTTSYIEMLRICDQNRGMGNNQNKFGGEPYDLEIAIGVEFRRESQLLYIALARNNNGFQEINRFLSHHNLTGKSLPAKAPDFDQVYIVYPYRKEDPETLRENEFIGIGINDISAFMFDKGYRSFKKKYVVLQPVTFADKVDFNIHRLLRAIDKNTLLSKLPVLEQANENEIMLPEVELEKHFQRYPQVLHNTRKLLDEDKNKKDLTGSPDSDWDYLVTRAWEGFQKRYNVNDGALRERFDRELRIIKFKGFCGYYLIAYDMIQFATSK